MGFLAAVRLVFVTHWMTTLRSRRALICLLLALTPALVTLLPPVPQASAEEVVQLIGMMLLLQLVAPVIGLVAGSFVFSEEVENRTITYPFTRPVPRAALFLGRYLATLVLVCGLLGLCALAVPSFALMRGRPDDLAPGAAADLITAAVLAGAIYSLITGALGVFVKRPIVFGLFYLIAMEGVLANLPGSGQRATLQYYLRSISTRLGVEENEFLRENPLIQDTVFLPPTEAVVRLLVFIGLGLVVAGWGIRRRQYVLTS